MLALTNQAIINLNTMRAKWDLFKRNRSKLKYEKTQGKGFLTAIQREEMIEDLFGIYQNKTEEIKILETPQLFQ